ncbi:MAG: FAD-binding oxidoreductase [Chitinophagaceae bacterium]|nr:FAD-binding oxidoreductase [Chitinophagaceae bacterium]
MSISIQFPHLTFEPEFNWTGTFGVTRDGLPYVGACHKMPNAYFCLGFGGNGIVFSQIGAEIIADIFLKKPNKNADIFSFNRH